MTSLERAALILVSLVAAAVLGGFLGGWVYDQLADAVDVSGSEVDAVSPSALTTSPS